MKALTYRQYGSPDVLQLKQVDKPVAQAGQVLIKVYATTVNRTDNATIKGIPFFVRIVTGLFKPKKEIPGTEFAGVVEALGEGVVSLNVGDRVFGFYDLGAQSHAQYLAIKEEFVVTMPEGVSFEQMAASSEGAHYAYSTIKKMDFNKVKTALVYGASGAIGSAMVQLLHHFGVQVTAVCSTKNLELMKGLGANKVIDYTKQDFTKDQQRYDFVDDAVGKSSFFKCKKLLNPGGVYLSSDLGFMAQNIFLPLITPVIKPLLGNKKTIFPIPTEIRRSLLLIKKLTEEGKFKTVIDREYPLEQIVDAYRYVEKEKKIGNVVIVVGHE